MKLAIINSVRTNNFHDDKMMQKIIGLWKGASSQLTEHEGIRYGVYHEYADDYKGDYSLSVCVEGNVEPSMEIPNSNTYEIFPVDTADEQGIIKAWKKIWQLEESGIIHRAYSYDFEKYYPNGEIEIHIAVKN
jgi:hypothetical protein